MKKLSTINYKLLTSKGFTLIELLIVIVIIATLAVTVFVAINPAKRFQDARDARRTSDVQSILTAIQQSIIDNKGALPAGLSAGMAEEQLGTDATGCAIATGGCSVVGGVGAPGESCLDLSTPLVTYLKSIATDPKDGTAGKTKYAVVVDTNGITTVKACGTEGTTPIAVSR